jgi:tetratricopeptide (TPR) repeat protein
MKLGLATIVVGLLEARALAAPTAEELYAQGQAAYDAADYATAIARWTRSYDLSGEPELLFNLAQAYRLDHDCVRALSTYRRFIRIDLKSEQRALAVDLERELEPKCGAPPTEPTSMNPRSALKTTGVATGGGGLALLATGLLFGRRSSELGDEVSRACSVPCDWAAQRGKDAHGRRDASIGYALDAVGVAAIAGGAVLYYVGRSETTVTVAPPHGETGAVISWGRSW